MKKDMLNELSGLENPEVNEIAENAPELDKRSQERILRKCLLHNSSEDEITVSGTDLYRRPKFRGFAAAAAAVVIIGGAGGTFALGKHLSSNAPADSKVGLQPMTEDSTDVREVDMSPEEKAALDAELLEAELAAEEEKISREIAEQEKIAREEYLKMTNEVQEPDCTEPAEGQTEKSKYPELEGLPDDLRKKYEEAIDSLQPGEEIHLPCLPVSELPTDSGETTTCPPQTTTEPVSSPGNILDEPPPYEPGGDPISPPVSNMLTYNGTYWIASLEGYWISDWGGTSYLYFEGKNHSGNGTFYNDNTCTGYSFEYDYYCNVDSRIELTVKNADGTLSDTLYGTGTVIWTDGDNFYIQWKEGTPIRQGKLVEHFTRNTSQSMPE